MANCFRQFRLLLWKNFILQIRRPIGTAFEILVPLVLIFGILVLPKLLKDAKKEDFRHAETIESSQSQYNYHCFETFETQQLSREQLKRKLDGVLKGDDHDERRRANKTLAFYPTGDPVASLMTKVSRTTGFKVTNKSVLHNSKTFKSLDDVISEATEHNDNYMGAIVFDINEGKSELPSKVKYTIRLTGDRWDKWNTGKTYPKRQESRPRSYTKYEKIFIPIQYAVDMAIIQAKTNMPSIIPLNLQQFPYPDYTTTSGPYIPEVGNLLPLMLTLAFIYTAMSIIKEIVFEKQNRLKESMKMMGLANWIHWAAWYTKCLLFLLLSLVLITAMLKGFKIFQHSNGFLLFLFFLFYAMSAISYCFFISVFFSNPILSMLFGSVLWLAASLPFQIVWLQEKIQRMDRSVVAAMCLLPNSALGIGARIFSLLEGMKIGVSFNNIDKPLLQSPEDTFTLAGVMCMMLVSSLVFMILTWYVEGIFPGKYGISKPFYFPLLKSYWCGQSNDDLIEANSEEAKGNELLYHGHEVEDDPADMEVGVCIKNLRKVFKSSTGTKVAVDGLSLKIFKGQITALLGHNGAGKTTTISILTGLFPPSAGSAMIGNKSILTDIDAVRESLGLCPQHNVLFDRLTVKEHLEFFANLKGKYGQAAKDEVMAMITDMQLLDKTNKNSSTLSGGMKRKLSCAIALIGGSETVFLDEPTSGMDPYARRATWDLLLKYKEDKTIILTTHFMDEADFLGDRIAIMADGQLRCCGSSLFLKSRYGVGYHLTLVKQEDFDKDITMSVIKRVIPSAEILSDVGAELELILDRESAKSFGSLFHELETKKEEYGIASFGVSVTTMEEVFMKVGEGSEKTVENIASDHRRRRDTEMHIEMPNDDEPEMGELLKGLPLKWQQYKAMLIKRFLNSKREKKAVVTQIILPLVMVLLGLMIMNAKPEWGNEPARVLTFSNLSTGGSNVVAFYADFRQTKTDIKVAKDFLKTSKVDIKDVSGDVKAVHLGNMGNSIEVKGTSYNYTAPINNETSTACCEYQFFILNKKCKSDFKNKSLLHYACYKERKNKNHDIWCPYIKEEDDLDDMNVYFSEYVVEKSDAKDYFKKHVAGFTFGPPPTIKNVTTSNNVTNTTKSVVVMPDTMSTVWYSNKAYHTIAEALNAMSNILLRQHSRVDDFIETINHPLPDKAEDRIEEDEERAAVRVILLSFLLAMGMAFMAASFITFLVKERSSKAKHLQFVSGVDAICYWLATFTWDYINYLIPAVLVLILFAAFQIDEFKDDLGTVLLLLLLFGFCVLPFVYCLSFVFTSPLMAYALTVFILSILSLAMLITVFVYRLMGEKYKEDAEIMHYVFMLFPTYTLSISFHDMSTNYKRRKSCKISPEATRSCKSKNITYTENPLDWDMPGVGQEVLFMFLEAIVLFILAILIQVNFLVGIASKENSENAVNAGVNRDEDEDVRAERQRVLGLNKENIEKESVVIKNLTKVYRGSDRTAVDHLCIGIPKGECFGLLGVNGAGKTTTFSMLTGDQRITEGSAYLDGYNLQTQLRQVQQRIGYCPQFDALIERMTGREMLKMYAQLRGVHPSKIDEIVSSTISKLNLGKWADKLSGNYSGGNKRKLSTAIALVGDPPIVFLDEPTSGMDPVARRFLWNALIHVMKGGRSIVLTSHSMEECEALCTRLAIMVNGQFKCIGSTQHLKSRFGTGYTLMIKVKGSNQTANSAATVSQVTPVVTDTVYTNPTATNRLTDVHAPGYPMHNTVVSQQLNTTPVAFVPPPSDGAYPQQQVLYMGTDAAAVSKAKSFIDGTFQGAVLMESHSGMLTYHIINEDLTWSQIFGNLERNREILGIVDYSVSQTTLDQVFINFAKEQHSEERTKVKRKCGCLPCC